MEANSLRRLIKQISLFLLIAVLLTTSCFAESMHQQIDNPNLTLDVTVGYDGLMTYGKTMPVQIRIENHGADLEGIIAVNAYDSLLNYNRYEVALTLAQGSTKEILIPIRVGSQQRIFTVEVLQDGEKICAVNAAPEQLINPSSMLIGVLSPDPKDLSYMNITMETDDLLRSEYSQIVPLSLASFPNSANLLNAFGLLVVDGYDISVFSEEQKDALYTWLNAGHVLIVGGGAQAGITYPSFTELTGILPGQVSQNQDITPALLTYLGISSAALGQELLLNASSGGNVLVSDGETPLIWKTAVGNGVIYTTAFELGAKPLSSWPLMHTFWQRVLLKDCYDLYQKCYSGAGYSYSSMSYVATRLPIANDFGVKVVLSAAAGLLVVFTIIVYIILMRKDKRQYLWFALPAISILCAAMVCYAATGLDSNQPTMLSIQTLKQEADGTQDFDSVASVALPFKGQHLVTIEDGTLRPENDLYEDYYYDDEEQMSDEPTQLSYRYLFGEHSGIGMDFTAPWRAHTFAIENTAFSTGKIDAVLWREEDGIHGYIVNNTGIDLSEGVVLCKMGYCSVPALRDGERYDLLLRDATFADPKKPVYEDGCIYESLSAAYFDTYGMVREYFLKTSHHQDNEDYIESDADTSARINIMQELVSSDYGSKFYQTICFYYVAFTDDLPAPNLALDGTPITRTFSRGAVRAEMNFLSVGNTGIIYHAPGMDPATRCEISESGAPYVHEGYMSAAESYHRLSESPAFMFDLAEVKDADLSKLIIYDEIQSPLVQLYLYDGKNWVEQKLAEEIPNPKKYIDEDGRLFIQFRAVGNASEYMEVTTPVLMLEGRAK